MMSSSQQSKLGVSDRPACSKCKRFLPRSCLCSFCGADNAPPFTNRDSMNVKNTADGCSTSTVDVVRALADLADRVSNLTFGLDSGD